MNLDTEFDVNILKEAASKIVLKNPLPSLLPGIGIQNLVINFDAGRDMDILNQLSLKDESFSNLFNLKYPLIAVRLPILHKVGTGYETIRIPRIVIAMLATREHSAVMPRFSEQEVFRNVLQPIYKQFLKYIAASKWTALLDPNYIPHSYFYSPGVQPIGSGLNDYVDIIEILNMELLINNIQNCK